MRSAVMHGAHSDPISRFVLSDSPVLIFEVDAAGIERTAAPARRCDVRLVGSMRGKPQSGRRDSRNGELSAVLLLRAMTASRLLSCVRAVTSDGLLLSPELLCQTLLEPSSAHVDGNESRLTARERDVLQRLADGDTTREIAERLSYSERTVKKIVHDLLAKLNCKTRAQAVALAARRGAI